MNKKDAFPKERAIKLREHLELTQTEMAVRFRVTEQSLRGWERGKNFITGTAYRLYELEEALARRRINIP